MPYVIWHMSYVICHISYVTCQYVTCRMPVICHMTGTARSSPSWNFWCFCRFHHQINSLWFKKKFFRRWCSWCECLWDEFLDTIFFSGVTCVLECTCTRHRQYRNACELGVFLPETVEAASLDKLLCSMPSHNKIYTHKYKNGHNCSLCRRRSTRN